MNTLEERFAPYRKLLLLHAESAGLVWGRDGGRIREIAIESDRLTKENCQKAETELPSIQGMYWDDELSHLWAVGRHDPFLFLHAGLEFLALEADNICLGRILTLRAFAHTLGPEVTDRLCALALDMMMGSYGTEYRRIEAIEQDEETAETRKIYAPLDSTDTRFEEASFVRCASTDEHATLISIAEIDCELATELNELIELRSNAARQALRGELVR